MKCFLLPTPRWMFHTRILKVILNCSCVPFMFGIIHAAKMPPWRSAAGCDWSLFQQRRVIYVWERVMTIFSPFVMRARLGVRSHECVSTRTAGWSAESNVTPMKTFVPAPAWASLLFKSHGPLIHGTLCKTQSVIQKACGNVSQTSADFYPIKWNIPYAFDENGHLLWLLWHQFKCI